MDKNQVNKKDELSFKSLEDKVEKVGVEVQKTVRRVDTLQKSVDLLYEDRQILEDIQASIGALKSQVLAHQQHIDLSVKDVKADVKEGQAEMGGKVEEVKDAIREVISTSAKNIKIKNTDLIKKTVWQKFKGFFAHN